VEAKFYLRQIALGVIAIAATDGLSCCSETKKRIKMGDHDFAGRL
jgi:hypothetical protein